jgi:hypothetical protein
MRGTSKMKKGKSRPLYMQLIRRHCVPLHAVGYEPKSTRKVKYTGGSALLWETICGRFFVTAAHVWRRLAELTQRPSAERRLVTYDVNGPVLIHGPRLIDQSEELDIAVFDVLGIQNFNPAGKAFLRTPGWVTSPAKSGEMIVGAGYPGAGPQVQERAMALGNFGVGSSTVHRFGLWKITAIRRAFGQGEG